MSIYSLDRIFKPSSVAVIGASAKRTSVGYALYQNILNGGFSGKIFPVNPKMPMIEEMPVYQSVLDIQNPIDLAVIATPIQTIPSIIKDCSRAGVGGVVITSAGGRETGEKGKAIEQKIKSEAAKSGIRMIGPNCVGIISSQINLNATFVQAMPLSGKVAFISQSGAMCAAILDLSKEEGIGFSHFVSIGGMLDVDFGDLIDYLGNDPRVGSILLYVENLTNVRKFMSASRAVSRIKPIVALKAGSSEAGARAAASHSGAVAGEDAVYDAAFSRAGIERVEHIEELFDCAELMSKQAVPKGPELAIITNGGGPGVMAADALSNQGIEPVLLGRETLEKLNAFLPAMWSRKNPIDILGDATPERWRRAFEVCLFASEIRALVVIFVPQGLTAGDTVAKILLDVAKEEPHKPIFAVWMGGRSVEESRRILNHAGMPTYDTPERAVSAFLHLYSYSHNLSSLQEIPSRFSRTITYDRDGGRGMIETALRSGYSMLAEDESKDLLRFYGIPVNPSTPAETMKDAAEAAQEIGFPVVLKVRSRKIIHKSDIEGVQLNLGSREAVQNAFSEIVEKAKSYVPEVDPLGVTVQPMIQNIDYELMLGSKKDPDFGPVIVFGMGGVMTEVLKDHALSLPPLNRLLAKRLMEKTKIYGMLGGYRNRPPVDLAWLEEIIIRLSQMVSDFSEISELDINPLVVTKKGICAADARVYMNKTSVPSPLHLIISPYPREYETVTVTKDGLELLVRPIRPEDAPLLLEMFQTLSKRSIYYRFFSPLKSMPFDMIARLTQVDYDRDMALVAIDRSQEQEKMLGVARLVSVFGGKRGELAVEVGDAWQGRGIGSFLLEKLLRIALARGMETLEGVILSENTHMMALARKLGPAIDLTFGEGQFEMKIDLKALKMDS